jgi:type IV fimbrial biogenesis protein FimT
MRAATRGRSGGFTLTEMMIVVAVLGTMVMIALPNFRQMLRTWEVRAAADSAASGIMRARAEAVSRNVPVQFVMATTGAWTVDYVTKPVSTDPALDTKPASEGSPNAAFVIKATDLTTDATTLTFNNLGQVVSPNPDMSPPIARITVTSTGTTQTLLVNIGVGGNARVCDPALPSGHVRAC